MNNAKLQPQKRSAFAHAVLDSWILTQRSLRHILSNRDQILGLTIQPVMFMLLFRYVFGGAIETGSTTYVNFLVAGILIQMASFGALTTSMSVAADLQRGIVERIKSLPTVSSALMTGHVIGDLARNMLSSAILLAVAFVVGFRPTASPIEWIYIVLLLLLYTFAISWLSAIMGLIARTVESVQWMGFFFVFPLTFASSAFVPTEGMPWALKIFAENQPVTHVIEAMRSLMVGTPMGNHMTLAVIWCLGTIVVAVPIAAYLFRKG